MWAVAETVVENKAVNETTIGTVVMTAVLAYVVERIVSWFFPINGDVIRYGNNLVTSELIAYLYGVIVYQPVSSSYMP